MTTNIKILPTGHEFSTEHGESILEGGLRHGKALEYRCNNGSCGDCKAKLISGDVEKIRFHDYRFTREEKRAGSVLLCCVAAQSDTVLEAHEIEGVNDIPQQSIKAKVSKVEQVTDDWVLLDVKTPRMQSLRFLAGQQVTLSFDGLPLRNKSIASCPCNGRHLQFHIHRSGGVFSDYIFNDLKSATKIGIEGPIGAFVLDDETKNPLLFIAYDSGFAPIKSLLEHVHALELEQPTKFYWISSEPKPYLHKLCRAWHDAMDNFDFEIIHTPNGVAEIPATIEQIIPGVTEMTQQEIYMTLPMDFVDAARAAFIAAGARDALLKTDVIAKYR